MKRKFVLLMMLFVLLLREALNNTNDFRTPEI